MKQFKQKLNTIINKTKTIFGQSIKDSKLMDVFFISFVFVMFGLSIMGICIAISSNRYKSAVLTNEKQDGDIKEISGDGSFLKRDEETEDNQVDEPNIENPQTPSNEDNNQSSEPSDGSENFGNGSENNSNNGSTGNNSSSGNNGSTGNNGSAGNNNSSNNSSTGNNSSNNGSNNSNNNQTDSGSENINPNNSSTPTEHENPPEKILTITCTSSSKSDIKKDGVIYPTSMIEQIIAKFDANTKRFYRADVSLALYYRNTVVNDLESLQKLYENRLKTYAGYFEISNPEIIFSAPTQAYINLKELDYNTYKIGYQKETETYDSFLYTFKTGGYMCTT